MSKTPPSNIVFFDAMDDIYLPILLNNIIELVEPSRPPKPYNVWVAPDDIKVPNIGHTDGSPNNELYFDKTGQSFVFDHLGVDDFEKV